MGQSRGSLVYCLYDAYCSERDSGWSGDSDGYFRVDTRSAAIRALGKPGHVLYDLKYVFPASESDLRL